jgi:hypothetical protein
MKQLFFAGSFAILSFIAYGVTTSTNEFSGKGSVISQQNAYDTIPKKDTSKKKKNWGKDSTMRRDSLNPLKDTTKH